MYGCNAIVPTVIVRALNCSLEHQFVYFAVLILRGLSFAFDVIIVSESNGDLFFLHRKSSPSTAIIVFFFQLLSF